MIIIPNRGIWTRQPTEPVDIDWSNPLAHGLAFANPLRPGVGMLDLVQKQMPTWVGDSARGSNRYGEFAKTGSQYLSFAKQPQITHTQPCSITWIQEPSSVSGYHTALEFNVGGGGAFLAGFQSTLNPEYCMVCGFRSGVSDTSRWSDFGPPVAGVATIYTAVFPDGVGGSHTNCRLYRDGVGYARNGLVGLTSNNGDHFYIGAHNGGYDPFYGLLGNVLIHGRALDEGEAKGLYENPWQVYKRRSRHVFVGASGGGADVTTSGSIGSLSLSAATGAATGAATTSGSIGSISLSAASGSATSSVSATAAIEAVSLSAATGSATGSATATGAVNTVSLSATTGTASTAGDATTDGAIAALSLSAATGAATGTAVASGAIAAVSLGAAAGTAATTSDVSATGSITTISLTSATGAASTAGDVVAAASMPALGLSAPTGSATGAATTSAAIASISLSAIIGTAAAGADVSASGSIAAIGLAAPTGTATPSIQAQAALAALSLSAPTGSSTGTATASAALSPISLLAVTGTASAGADISTSGSIAVIGLTAPVGTATISIEAQAAIAAVFMSAPTGVATGSATCSGAMPAISLSACRGAASNGLEDLPYLSQMVFARTFEQREFARINDGRYFVRRT